MERSRELEFQYAKRLRESTRAERAHLYEEAYTAVCLADARMQQGGGDPERRTAGTNRGLIRALRRSLRPQHRILEVGCGRGFTMLGLAAFVREAIGVDVSEPSLREARQLLDSHHVTNATLLTARADDLTSHFAEESFDKVISIDVYEHLHPEDGAIHLAQVYQLLRPGGEYFLISPNRVTGPADITREEYPEAEAALGFHLNEPTYGELLEEMKSLGFDRFRSLVWFGLEGHPWLRKLWPLPRLVYPAAVSARLERLLAGRRRWARRSRIAVKLLCVSLVARKGPSRPNFKRRESLRAASS